MDQTLFSSALSLGTVLVVGLNLLFQPGTSKRQIFDIDPVAGLGDNDVLRMMEELGATWGMRPEVAGRAANRLHELMIYFGQMGVRGPVHITAQFDEFNLDFNVEYAGPAVHFPDKPPRWRRLLRRKREDAAAVRVCGAWICGWGESEFGGGESGYICILAIRGGVTVSLVRAEMGNG